MCTVTLLDDFARVSAKQPCPVCNHRDWCLVSREDETNPSKVVCARVESRRRFGQAGWLHVLRDDGKRWDGVHRRTVRLDQAEPRCERFAALVSQYQEAIDPGRLALFAKSLGLTVESLERLGVGSTGEACAFPMTDPDDRVVRIHLRFQGGVKR